MKTIKVKRQRRHGPMTKYPFDRWFQQIRKNAKRGPDYWLELADFDCDVMSFANYLRNRARDAGLTVEVHVEDELVYARIRP